MADQRSTRAASSRFLTRAGRGRRVVAAALACLAAGPSACSTRTPREGGTVGLDAFVSDAGRPAAIAPPPGDPAAAGSGPAGPAPLDVTVAVGPPGLAGDAEPVEEPMLVDELVGEISGEAIYANEFFEPIGARLRNEARTRAPADWLEFTRDEISGRVRGLVTDALMREEGRAGLTPEMRPGLFAFLERIRRTEQRKSLGSFEAADRRLRVEKGMGLDEYMAEAETRAFIDLVLEELNDRVQVSSEDIRRYYENNPKLFNPDPVARFRRIDVPATNPAGVEAVRAALAAGTPFAGVAALPANTYYRERGGRVDDIPFTGPRTEAEFFGRAVLNDAARGLEPGRHAGPLEFGGDMVWLHLEAVVENSVSLYDAQVEIERRLREQRLNEELSRFLTLLRDRAGDLDDSAVVDRLVEIAVVRYGPRGL